LEIPYQKSYQIGQKSDLKSIFFHFFNSKLNPLLTQGSGASSEHANSGGWLGLEAHLCSCHAQHHSNHSVDAWSIQMSDEEEPAPCAHVSENEDDSDSVSSDAKQASMAQKRCKTSVTKCEDEYAVSQRREALSAKANTGKFLGLHAEKPAKPNSAKTAKHSGKDFVYGVLFVTLLAFCAKKPLNHTAK